MGLLPFNVGEIASRIVRGAGVRGRTKLTLDDNVVQVIQVGDYTRPPFRQDECSYFASSRTANAAGDGEVFMIQNDSPKTIVVEWFRLLNFAAAAQTIKVAIWQKGGFAVNTISTIPFRTSEKVSGNIAQPLVNAPQVLLVDGRVAGGILNAGPQVDDFILTPTGIAGAIMERSGMEIAIPSGFVMSFAIGTVNTAFGLSAKVRVVDALVGA